MLSIHHPKTCSVLEDIFHSILSLSMTYDMLTIFQSTWKHNITTKYISASCKFALHSFIYSTDYDDFIIHYFFHIFFTLLAIRCCHIEEFIIFSRSSLIYFYCIIKLLHDTDDTRVKSFQDYTCLFWLAMTRFNHHRKIIYLSQLDIWADNFRLRFHAMEFPTRNELFTDLDCSLDSSSRRR